MQPELIHLLILAVVVIVMFGGRRITPRKTADASASSYESGRNLRRIERPARKTPESRRIAEFGLRFLHSRGNPLPSGIAPCDGSTSNTQNKTASKELMKQRRVDVAARTGSTVAGNRQMVIPPVVNGVPEGPESTKEVLGAPDEKVHKA